MPEESTKVDEHLEGYVAAATEEEHGNPRSFAVEGNDPSGYVGVSPEYRTYADDRHKPMNSDEENEAAGNSSKPKAPRAPRTPKPKK